MKKSFLTYSLLNTCVLFIPIFTVEYNDEKILPIVAQIGEEEAIIHSSNASSFDLPNEQKIQE